MQITTDTIKEQIPYYLSQEAKENLAKALDRFPREIDYYTDLHPNQILQGDGWTSFEIIRFENGDRKLIKAVVLSNSCDISLDNKRDLPAKLTFAPLIRLERYLGFLRTAGLDAEKINNKITAIKEQKVTPLFFLPKGAGLDDDYVALLDDLHTLPFKAFCERNERNKMFTLDQVGFYLFLLKLSVHFCRFHEEVIRHR